MRIADVTMGSRRRLVVRYVLHGRIIINNRRGVEGIMASFQYYDAA